MGIREVGPSPPMPSACYMARADSQGKEKETASG